MEFTTTTARENNTDEGGATDAIEVLPVKKVEVPAILMSMI
jgi:hypothetical protein